jgi:hypothetical protein
MKKRLSVLIVLLGVAYGLLGSATRALPPGETSSLALRDLEWLAGVWRTNDGGLTEEHWAMPVGASMMGMCRIGDQAAKTVYEILLIEEREGRLIYSMKHFTAGLVDREDKALVFDVRRGDTERSVVFDGGAQTKPTVITYRLESKDKLVCTLLRQREGKELRSDFHMTRVRGAAP